MLSVIIPAFNEEAMIAKCLEALCRQETAEPFEVIVVDNNSTDRTVLIAQSFGEKLRLQVLHEPVQSRGAARKTGFAAARGNILFSTDADAIVPPYWLESHCAILRKRPEVAATTGSSIIVDCTPMCNAMFNFLHPVIMDVYRMVFGYYFLCGFNFAIRREAYERVGGFRTDIDGQEDVDLAIRVKKIGKIHHLRAEPVIFSGRRFQRGLLRGYWDYIRAFFTIIICKNRGRRLSDVR